MAAVVVATFSVLVVRLVFVQVLDRPGYADLADRQALRTSVLPQMRGSVLDRGLTPLAMSDVRYTVWLDPGMLADPWADASAVSEATGSDPEELYRRMSRRPGSRFVYVVRQADRSVAEAVESLGIAGVHVRQEEARLHPSGAVGRGVVGLTDVDQVPLSGVELAYDHVLRARDGSMLSRTARGGMPLPEAARLVTGPSRASDLVLALDAGLQWEVERILTDAVALNEAAAAGAVVMSVRSGDLLAVASVQDGNPPVPSSYSRPHSDAYEPGSVAKTFLVAAALEEGVTWPAEKWSLPVSVTHAGRVFAEPFRTEAAVMSTTEALARSSNVAMVRLSARMPPETQRRYLHRLGLGRLTGPDGAAALPGESAGVLRPASQWHGTDQASIGFGQGLSVTAVQLAAAYNAIAADGMYVRPRLVLRRIGPDGSVAGSPPDSPERVLSSGTAESMRSMLATAVEHGTGSRARLPSCSVAGKTGTAQKAGPAGGYADGLHVSSFVGFFPAADPEFTVAVYLDEPAEPLAGRVAAPLFAEVAAAVMWFIGEPDAC